MVTRDQVLVPGTGSVVKYDVQEAVGALAAVTSDDDWNSTVEPTGIFT